MLLGGTAYAIVYGGFMAQLLEKEIEDTLGRDRMRAALSSASEMLQKARKDSAGKSDAEYSAMVLRLIKGEIDSAIAGLPPEVNPAIRAAEEDRIRVRSKTPAGEGFDFWKFIGNITGTQEELRAMKIHAATLMGSRLWKNVRMIMNADTTIATTEYRLRLQGQAAADDRFRGQEIGYPDSRVLESALSLYRSRINMFEAEGAINEVGLCDLSEANALIVTQRKECLRRSGSMIRELSKAAVDNECDILMGFDKIERCRTMIAIIARLLEEAKTQTASG